MAKLAIKGHKTRGKEVIEILKMLGGKNKCGLEGNSSISIYFIEGEVIMCIFPKFIGGIKLFTLEEFLEKFPYKVGDKVQHKGATSCGSIFEIEEMRWEEDTIKYTLRLFGCNYKTCTLPAEYLQPYKEEDMETITIDDFKANTKEWLIDKLESMSKDNALQTINNIYDELHKPKYPKTYEECCNELKVTHVEWWGYLGEILVPFQKLLICRDAYWKIAGEEMGFKLWEPDWKNPSERKYCIVNTEGNITKWVQKTTNKILAFPTEEMRDAFYKNFKDLIEQCKELL